MPIGHDVGGNFNIFERVPAIASLEIGEQAILCYCNDTIKNSYDTT